ncbi:MAG: L,D-transpeptidase [Chloroflexota bacterium]
MQFSAVRFREPSRLALLAVGVLLIAIASVIVNPTHASAQEAPEEAADRLYFEQTGQVLEGPFLSAWLLHGGLDQTGHPISAPTERGDRWIQWFEYARLEIIDKDISEATANDVLRAPVGAIYARDFGYERASNAFEPVDSAGDGAKLIDDSGHSLANGFLERYETGDNAEELGKPISQEFSVNGTTYQFFEFGALSWKDGEIKRVPLGTQDAMLRGAAKPRQDQPENTDSYHEGYFIQSDAFAGERWIDVSLSEFKLTAYVGEVPVLTTDIVIGDDPTPTVTGEFNIWWKLPSQTMEGDNVDGTEYRQEDVPNVMYFFQDWAIHGAYWRSSFGYAASHGCINVPVDTSKLLYDWADVGTRVVVRD